MAHNTAICMWLNNNAVFLLQIENTPKFLVFFLFCFFFPIAIILVSVSEERGRKEHYSLQFHRHLQTVTHYDAQEQPHWDTLHRCSSRHTLQYAAMQLIATMIIITSIVQSRNLFTLNLLRKVSHTSELLRCSVYMLVGKTPIIIIIYYIYCIQQIGWG